MRDATRQSVMAQVFWYWVPVVLALHGTIFTCRHSHTRKINSPSLLFEEVSDKVLHGVEYGILALLCYRALSLGSRGRLSLGRRSCWRS